MAPSWLWQASRRGRGRRLALGGRDAELLIHPVDRQGVQQALAIAA
jgi:hypothetical protein